MNKQIVAISMGDEESPLVRNEVYGWIQQNGFAIVDEDAGLFSDGTGSSFVCSCFEKTQYILFKEGDGELPECVFDWVMNLKDDKTVISLGDEDESRYDIVRTDSEFTLKRFRKLWNEPYEGDDE